MFWIDNRVHIYDNKIPSGYINSGEFCKFYHHTYNTNIHTKRQLKKAPYYTLNLHFQLQIIFLIQIFIQLLTHKIIKMKIICPIFFIFVATFVAALPVEEFGGEDGIHPVCDWGDKWVCFSNQRLRDFACRSILFF